MTLQPTDLSDAERIVLGIVKSQTRLGDPVAAKDVADLAGQNGRGNTNSQTRRALTKLVERGMLTKPTPGNFLLAKAGDE